VSRSHELGPHPMSAAEHERRAEAAAARRRHLELAELIYRGDAVEKVPAAGNTEAVADGCKHALQLAVFVQSEVKARRSPNARCHRQAPASAWPPDLDKSARTGDPCRACNHWRRISRRQVPAGRDIWRRPVRRIRKTTLISLTSEERWARPYTPLS
jgi:hypothetical protein